MGTIISSPYLTDRNTEAQRSNSFKVPQLISDPGFKLKLTSCGGCNFPHETKVKVTPTILLRKARLSSSQVLLGRNAGPLCPHRFFSRKVMQVNTRLWIEQIQLNVA